jgi:uridylate kinase
MKKEKLVIKIGGSLIFNQKNKININQIKDFSKIIKNYANKYKIVIICGGGILAREFIKTVRRLGKNESICDIFGIEISRINSKLILSFLDDLAYPKIPQSFDELAIALEFEKIIVMGGLQPGQSTTSVALEVSEFIQSNKLIILTDVEGIYDKDPKKFEDAQLLHKISRQELKNMILSKDISKQASAGEYRIFDLVSLQILMRSKIPVSIISGKDLNQFEKLLAGDTSYEGTRIIF